LIGLVATIVEWKGHHVVIEAARRLRDKFPVPVPWRIVFVGEVFEGSQVDAAYKAGLEEQVRRDGLEDLVLFAGRKTDMPGVYAGLDVVLNASVEPEPLGTTIYEAMAMGRPVVVSNLGGSPEIVDGGRAGYLVPAGDSQELARTLAAVLQGPAELPSLVAAARRRVEDCFDLAKTVEQYERYFASFAKKG
jgi:glycosyltransferase involved in cell wall biosynthesis